MCFVSLSVLALRGKAWEHGGMWKTQQHRERFWSKVDKSGECWEWLAAKNRKGYGVAWDGWRTQKAHRVAWADAHGGYPDGCLLHQCDNPGCVNPGHMRVGSRAENNAEMVSRGRHVPGGTYGDGHYVRGTTHHAARLTPTRVREIRHDRLAGMSYAALGRKYGINQSAAWKVCNGKLWRHVT